MFSYTSYELQVMRVLYLTINPNRASTTVPTEGWLRELRPRGLEPVICATRKGDFLNWAAEEGIPGYCLDLPVPNKWNPAPFISSLYQLWRITRRHRIQLIHCNEQDIYPIGCYLGRISRRQTVVSIQFTMERTYCIWAFAKRRQPARVFFCGAGNQENCRPGMLGVVPEERWRVLNNAVDMTRFRPDPVRRERFRSQFSLGNDVVLGVACWLQSRKQVDHLIRAANTLGPRTRVLLAGDATTSEREYTSALLNDAKSSLGERFLHLGHLSDLRDFYNGLDLFVNTSREEGCSISVIEALACGVPVVGYPSKSVDLQILPGAGEIVPQDREDLLVAALQRWVQDPTLREAAKLAARTRAENDFDIKNVANQLWNEYQQLVAR